MANQIQPSLMGKSCGWLKGLTDTTQFEETWKPWELMERSSKLKKPGNSWILSFSHAILNFSPCVCVYLSSFPKGIPWPCLRLPSKFSQGYTVTLHLPNGGVKYHYRIQRTKETWLKPTPCSASILEILDRHRNYLKQIRLDMLSTNTNQRTHEGCVETIGSVLSNLQGKHMLLESII